MPSQGPTMGDVSLLMPRSPGALNLLFGDLTDADILSIINAGSPSAQTTLEQLRLFLVDALAVDDLAALKALLVRPGLVTMKGWAEAGDGGEGVFWWDADSTTTADDGLVVQCTAGAAGRYKRLFAGGLMDLAWWGPAGDGVTADGTKVRAAVAAAFAASAELFFPDGSYLVTGTIPNLHDVRKRGPGAIVSSTSTFYVEPAADQTNTLFHSTAGLDTNDGLTAGRALLTSQQAMDIVQSYPSARSWIVQYTDGETVTELSELTYDQDALKDVAITFNGAAPGTGLEATVILQGSTDGTRTHDYISATGGLRVTINDIFVKSFITPLSGSQFSRVSAVNVWAKNCRDVVSIGNMGFGSASYGYWDGRDLDDNLIASGTGFNSVIGSFYNLEQPVADETRLRIDYFNRNVVVDESGSGHMDKLRTDHGQTANIELTRGYGSPNMSGLQCWNSPIGILARGSGPLLISNTADFTGCTNPIVYTDAATVAQTDEGTTHDSRRIWQARTRVDTRTVVAGAGKGILWAPAQTVRARMRARDTIDIQVRGRFVGALAAVATVEADVGGVSLGTFDFPIGADTFEIDLHLIAVNKTDLRGWLKGLSFVTATGLGTVNGIRIGTKTDCVSLTAESQITIYATVTTQDMEGSDFVMRSTIAGLVLT